MRTGTRNPTRARFRNLFIGPPRRFLLSDSIGECPMGGNPYPPAMLASRLPNQSGGFMQDDLAAVSCHGCGVYDASLRHSEHPSVISTLIAANESARVGVWCARCRGIEAAKAATISLLAGWWSARGPKRT